MRRQARRRGHRGDEREATDADRSSHVLQTQRTVPVGLHAAHRGARNAVACARASPGVARGAVARNERAEGGSIRQLRRRRRRLFGIEIESCARCGGKLRILARIEAPEVIAKILSHLARTAPEPYQSALPLGARAPPAQARLL
jgi:hypothetical protein